MKKIIIFAYLPLLPVTTGAYSQVSADYGGINGGAVVIGSSSTTCSSSIEGALRYNSVSKTVDLCDGTGWSSINLSCDITPDGFNITDVGSVPTGTLQTSPIVQITGITCSVTVSISGTGSPEYRTCSNSDCSTEIQTWTSANASIANNQYLQLRLTASPDSYSTRTATVNVGGAVDNWTVTTVNDGTYKRVFTVQGLDGAMGGLAGADAICQSAADAAALGGTFYAWLATDSTDDPESRFVRSTVPYKRIDGVQIANNWTDLVDGGSLAAGINLRADGSGIYSDRVYTNVNVDGTAISNTNNCNGWLSNGSAYTSGKGVLNRTSSPQWTFDTSSVCSFSESLLCFEQ